ncbi:MAG: hypothetical protein A2V83_04395 [Nitrospirae bacterium RBG_16_64_22]|nr:MAG: hypothetical protein A2V83_04395 [Nitrospirae bacterium RBG_16_64_22]
MHISLSLKALREAVRREFGIEVVLSTDEDVRHSVNMLIAKSGVREAEIKSVVIDPVLGEDATVDVAGPAFVEAISSLQRYVRS